MSNDVETRFSMVVVKLCGSEHSNQPSLSSVEEKLYDVRGVPPDAVLTWFCYWYLQAGSYCDPPGSMQSIASVVAMIMSSNSRRFSSSVTSRLDCGMDDPFK